MALACCPPELLGLHLSHWSSAELRRQALRSGLVEAISARTVRRILHGVELQPHRSRYWKTPRLDPEFRTRAFKVLWSYAQAQRLKEQGIEVVCADEMPNLQVLQRTPIRRARPGQIEKQEFEYVRHGTLNVLMFLRVASGKMELDFLKRKDAAHYQAALRRLRRRHPSWRGVYLIHDGDPSHTAHSTQQFLHSDPFWRVRQTPAHASWLNQGELLNRAFSRRYLRRHSFSSRAQMRQHLKESAPEYNRLYAHPFRWTFTAHKLQRWYQRHQARPLTLCDRVH